MCPPVASLPSEHSLCLASLMTASLIMGCNHARSHIHARDTHTMASVLKSISSAIITTFDTIGDVGSAVQKSVGMATNYIDRQATSADIVGIDSIKISTSRELKAIKQELDADAELKAIFDLLEDRFTK